MNPRAVWDFIAGESRIAPLGVALAVAAVVLLRRYLPDGGHLTDFVFVACLAAGLIAGVFEKV